MQSLCKVYLKDVVEFSPYNNRGSGGDAGIHGGKRARTYDFHEDGQSRDKKGVIM